MHIKRIILPIICTFLMSACSASAATNHVNQNNAPADRTGFKFSPIAHAQTAELLAFIVDYETLEKEPQKSAYLDVMQALEKDENNIKLRIKHAAILSLPNSTMRDTATAQQQLQSLLANPALSSSNKSLVKLLFTYTSNHNTESKKLHEATKRMDSLKQRNKALNRKLNDLKNIEKTMIERNANNKP